MSAAVIEGWDEDPWRLRWSGSFAFIVALHAAALWLSLHWLVTVPPDAAPPPAAVMLELAPLPSAPPTPLSDTPPGPKQRVSQPPPRPSKAMPLLPPTPIVRLPHVAVPVPPKSASRAAVQPIAPKNPSNRPDPLPPAPATTAPPEAATKADPVAAPAPGAAASPSTQAPPNWEGLLLGRLERFKRYPADAQWHHQQGVPYVRFAMDRHGKVLSVALARSSGVATLDAEAVALIHRAEPLPAPPAAVPGDPVELVVPVEFYLR